MAKVTAEQMLLDGEAIVASVKGNVAHPGGSPRAIGATRGILTLTNSRFIYVGAGLGSSTSRSFPLSTVTSIDLHKNLTGAFLQVTIAGGFERFLVKYAEAQSFVATAQEQLALYVKWASTPAPASAPTDIPAQIQQLASLRDSGILSEDEFATKKAELLARL